MSIRQWQNAGGEVTIGVVDGVKGTLTTMTIERRSVECEFRRMINDEPPKRTRGEEIAKKVVVVGSTSLSDPDRAIFNVAGLRECVARAIDAARAEMREACAKEAEAGGKCCDSDKCCDSECWSARRIAAAIRSIE